MWKVLIFLLGRLTAVSPPHTKVLPELEEQEINTKVSKTVF